MNCLFRFGKRIFPDVKAKIDSLRESGVSNFNEYFADNEDVLFELASLVKIKDVNKNHA